MKQQHLALAIVSALSLAACGGGGSSSYDMTDNEDSSKPQQTGTNTGITGDNTTTDTSGSENSQPDENASDKDNTTTTTGSNASGGSVNGGGSIGVIGGGSTGGSSIGGGDSGTTNTGDDDSDTDSTDDTSDSDTDNTDDTTTGDDNDNDTDSGSSGGSSSSSGGSGSSTTAGAITDKNILAISSDTTSAISQNMRNKITIDKSSKELSISGKQVEVNQSYDIGINGLADTSPDLKKDKFGELAQVIVVKDGDKAVYLRDPDTTKWKYQTFGQVFDDTTSKGYVSIGEPHDALPTGKYAHYSGVAMGTVNGESEVAAQMSARIDVEENKLDLNIYNSHISKNNINNQYVKAIPDANYDFTVKDIEWSDTDKVFKKDGIIEARLYGPDAEEIGGTYQRQSQNLTGAFGGKKAAKPTEPTITPTPTAPREGNGVPVIWFDGKFKAMKSLNTVNKSNPLERKHLQAEWDKLQLMSPNTIVGNRNEKNTQGLEVKSADPFDLTKTGTPQTINVTLKDDSTVSIEYDTSINNNANYVENGEYIARSVHIFGKRIPTAASLNHGNGKLNAAYVYGKVTEPGVINDIKTGKFDYDGQATYRSNDAEHTEKPTNGKSHFVVDFANKLVTNGKIEIDGMPTPFIFDNAKIDGSSFQTALFNNSKTFEYKQKEEPITGPQMRGRFYGESGNFIGGAFYNHDGVGTFFSSKGAAQP